MKIKLLYLVLLVTGFACADQQTPEEFKDNVVEIKKPADAVEETVLAQPEIGIQEEQILREGFYKIKISENDGSAAVDTVGDLAFILQNFVLIEQIALPEYHLQAGGDDKMVYSLEDREVIFMVQAFDSALHQIGREDGFLKSIDGRGFWGTDGDLPRRQISSIRIKQGGKTISLPDSSFNNLYEPSFGCLDNDYCYTRIYEYPGDNLLIRMNNSDGAGAYSVLLHIKEGVVVVKKVEMPF